MNSCSSMRSTPIVNQQSQITNQQLRIDSIYHYEKDSMAISLRAGAHVGSDPTCYPCGRTIGGQTLMRYPTRVDTLVVERWHTRWKDHVVAKTDTLKVTEYQQITETQKYVPRFYKTCTILFWIVLVVVVASIILRIVFRIYLHR